MDRVFRGPDAGRSLTIHPDLDRDQGLGLAGRGVTGLVDLVDRAVLGLVDPADPVDLRAWRAGGSRAWWTRGTGRAWWSWGLVDRGAVTPGGPGGRVDRHRRPTRPGAHTTG